MSERPGAGLRVGLVGCGSWGHHILRDLRLLGCEVPVVARSDASIARAREGGAAAVVPTVPELGDVAGVVIATPASEHEATCRSALAFGVPVYCEKPLTQDAVRAQALADEAGGRLLVLEKWRYHPAVVELARIAREQELGPVHGLHLVRNSLGMTWRPGEDIGWRHLPHDLGIADTILGTLPTAPSHAHAEVSGDRLTGLHAHFPGPPWVDVQTSGLAPAKHREIRLVCRDGAAINHDAAEEITIWHGDEPIVRRATPGELPLLHQLRVFVAHLRGGPPPLVAAQRGADAVAVIADVRRMAGLP